MRRRAILSEIEELKAKLARAEAVFVELRELAPRILFGADMVYGETKYDNPLESQAFKDGCTATLRLIGAHLREITTKYKEQK